MALAALAPSLNGRSPKVFVDLKISGIIWLGPDVLTPWMWFNYNPRTHPNLPTGVRDRTAGTVSALTARVGSLARLQNTATTPSDVVAVRPTTLYTVYNAKDVANNMLAIVKEPCVIECVNISDLSHRTRSTTVWADTSTYPVIQG